MKISGFIGLSLLVCSFLTFVGASAAQATVINGSFSGIVISGADTANRFGLGVGTDMTGDAITGTFSYDSDAYYMEHDQIALLNSDGLTYNYSSSWNPSIPSMTITDTINGHSVTTTSINRQDVGVNQNYNFWGVSPTAMFSVQSLVSSNQYASVSTGQMVPSDATILSDIWNIGTANFSVSTLNSDLTSSFGYHYDGSGSDVYNVQFNINSMTAGPASGPGPAPVPEPGTMMLLSVACLVLHSSESVVRVKVKFDTTINSDHN